MIKYAPLVGRILIGLLFLIVGIQKAMDLPGTTIFMKSGSLPYPHELALASIAIGIICGAALIAGFKVRYAAALLAFYMIAITAVFYTNFTGTQQQVLLNNLAVIGGLFYVMAYGSGKYSVGSN